MIYWAKRRCSPGAEIPFMKVLGDLQLQLGAPHELMMLSSHPLSHQDFEVFIGVPQRELLAPFEGFTEIQENELPDKLIVRAGSAAQVAVWAGARPRRAHRRQGARAVNESLLAW
jgi:hypothetical protein